MREVEIEINGNLVTVLITDDCHESTYDVLHEIKMISMLGIFESSKEKINND